LEFVKPSDLEVTNTWTDSLAMAETTYKNMLHKKIAPQIARSVLPNSLACTIAVTGNLRSWRHLFTMRCTQESHPDMKAVMIPLLKEFKTRIPLIFNDLEPNLKQSEALSKPR
jgi:thymidylate synthase (FAD)